MRRFSIVSLQATLDVEDKKGFFKDRRRFSRKAKGALVFAILVVLFISAFAFLPKLENSNGVPQNTPNPRSLPSATDNESQLTNSSTEMPSEAPSSAPTLTFTHNPTDNSATNQTVNSMWLAVATNSWNFFQPGQGVDSNTGLPLAGGAAFSGFTDWDLGVYIQAIIDAQKMNLISPDGNWGSNARFDKIISFLETRPLNATTGYPFWFYDARTGKDYHALSDASKTIVDTADTGRLLVALNNLRNFDSNFMARINQIVLNGRSNYAALIPGILSSASSNNIYDYYCGCGYASFWPQQLSAVPGEILDSIFNSKNITTVPGNVLLPAAQISCDPLLCSVFEVQTNDSRLMTLTNEVYSAHEAYYNVTNKYVAFSEGNSEHGYIWEWVVLSNGQTWQIQNQDDLGTNNYLKVNPVIYTKVAFSFLALDNTTFSQNMVAFLSQTLPDPSKGYSEGCDNAKTVVSSVGSNTNGLILDAALYAIQNNP